MDVMASLVKNIWATGFNDLPDEAKVGAKKGIIDTVGNTLAGSSVKGCQLLVDVVREMGGKKQSTVVVFGKRAPCNLATLANGSMARALEIDDVYDGLPLHPDASIVPAALAVAEWLGEISGRSLITAVALAQDLVVRMALATEWSPAVSGRLNPYKIFAATGAVGKLMRLTEEQMIHAMGISYSHMIGDSQAHRDGAMTHYIQDGETGKSAIESVILARNGITGTTNPLEGEKGFFSAFGAKPNLSVLTAQLGSRFRGADIAIKPYSSCRNTHEAIGLALEIARRERINPARIARVTVKVNDLTYSMTCTPLDEKRYPDGPVNAMFSLPYAVAAAFVKGDCFISEMTDECIKNAEVLHLASRVMPLRDKECETDLAVGATVMEIEMMGGAKFKGRKAVPLGNPKDPISIEGCLEKVRKCMDFAYRPFRKYQRDKLVDRLSNLEQLRDVKDLVQLLNPASRHD